MDRFQALSDSAPRRWGSMTAHQMLNHVRHLLEVALGERTMADFSNAITRNPVVRWLAIELPWPKGRINPPVKMLDDRLLPFAEERNLLIEAMGRFADSHARDPGRIVASPILGPITLDSWSRLQGKHLDYHLRQFGA